MTKTLKIPEGLNDDEFKDFIYDEVRKVGGDPDTLRLESIDGVPFEDQAAYSYEPINVTFKYNHDNIYNNDEEIEEPTVEKDIEKHGIVVRIVEDNYISVLKTFKEWNNYIKASK